MFGVGSKLGFKVASFGALAMSLAACGAVDNPAPEAVGVSVEELVQEPARACPVKPPPGQCAGRAWGTSGGGSSSKKITIASCNGVDDTAAIQDALTRADEVRLPAGTCAVSGLVVVKKPIKLLGQGQGRTILKYRSHDGDSCMFFSNGGHTVIADLTFDGSRDAGAAVSAIFIRPKTCVGPVAITRVDVRNLAGRGIIVSGDGVGTVNGVLDTDPGVGASPVMITGSHITSRDGGVSVATSSTPNIHNTHVRDNQIETENEHGIMVRGVVDALIANNRTRGGDTGLLLESGGSNVRFQDNDVAGARAAGVSLGGGALNSGSKVTIRRNHVSGCAEGLVMAHMSAGRFQDVAVTDNELVGNTGSGMLIWAGKAVTVARNHFEGNGLAGMQILPGPPAPASCDARCLSIDGLAITDNVFRAGAAVTSAGLAVVNADARGVVVSRNDLRYDAPAPPYRPVDVAQSPAAGELTFDNNQGWPTLVPAP